MELRESVDVRGWFPELAQIRDEELAAKVVRIWERVWEAGNWDRIEDLPVAPSIPYPHIRHAQAIVRAAVALADIFEEIHGVQLDRDVLIAGALLQDVSKLVEYRPKADGTFGGDLSDLGRQVQHAVYAAHEALAEGLPTEVVHIILTHSPQSAMEPRTKEAKILHHIDQADVAAVHDKPIFKRYTFEGLAL